MAASSPSTFPASNRQDPPFPLRGLKPGSQNARIVTYLADGREREMRDIHYAVGFCRLNSRISELRSHGWRIDCRREGSNWFYRLVSVPGDCDRVDVLDWERGLLRAADTGASGPAFTPDEAQAETPTGVAWSLPSRGITGDLGGPLSESSASAQTPETTAVPSVAAVVSDAWATRPDTMCAAGSGRVTVSVAASDLQLELPVAA